MSKDPKTARLEELRKQKAAAQQLRQEEPAAQQQSRVPDTSADEIQGQPQQPQQSQQPRQEEPAAQQQSRVPDTSADEIQGQPQQSQEPRQEESEQQQSRAPDTSVNRGDKSQTKERDEETIPGLILKLADAFDVKLPKFAEDFINLFSPENLKKIQEKCEQISKLCKQIQSLSKEQLSQIAEAFKVFTAVAKPLVIYVKKQWPKIKDSEIVKSLREIFSGMSEASRDVAKVGESKSLAVTAGQISDHANQLNGEQAASLGTS